MILEKIFELQKKLDFKYGQTEVVRKEFSFDKLVISTLVEIGEFANEVEFFKYWKINKKTTNKQVVLEEFADGLHFLSSIAIHLKIDPWKIETSKVVEKDPSLLLKKIYQLLVSVFENRNPEKIKEIFEYYFKIIKILGFEYQEIFNHFQQKNLKNNQRIKDKY